MLFLQDTCVALQALSKFAEKANGKNADFRLSGSLKMGNYYNHDFVITKENKLILQTVELPPKIIPGKLQVSGQGVGCALVQVKLSLKQLHENSYSHETRHLRLSFVLSVFQHVYNICFLVCESMHTQKIGFGTDVKR